MTSRSSSWVDLRENNKRRLWQWCVALFFLVIMNVISFLISVMSINTESYTLTYGARAREMMEKVVRGYAESFMGVSGLNIFYTALIAAILGIWGFAYLNDRVKIDFYESMPAKKGRRFSVIWVNGLVIFAASYIVGMLINYGILTAAGYGNVFSMGEALQAFFILLAFFAGVYHLAILSEVLTGTTFITVCAFVVLSCYEIIMRGIVIMLKQDFFDYVHTMSGDLLPAISPYGIFGYVLNDLDDTGSMMPHMLYLIVFDLALLILVYVLYHKRPLEAAGKTIAFKGLKPVLKFLLTIPVGLFVADIVYGILKDSSKNTFKASAITIIVTVIASILVSALIQGIFEQDIRLAFRKKLNWVLGSVAALLIFFGFRGDWLNIDRYVPSPSMVNSAVFIPQGYDGKYTFLDSDLDMLDMEEFAVRYMHLTDAGTVCDITRLSMDRYDKEMEILGEGEYPESGMFEYAVVIFRLKNGHTMSRAIQVPVKDETVTDLLDTLLSSKEFKDGYYDFNRFDIDEAISMTTAKNLDARYTDGVWRKPLTVEETIEFMDLYMKDIEDISYKDRLEEYPKGHVIFCIDTRDRYDRTMEYDIPVYPCMKGCAEYITKKGLDTETMDYKDEITGITVTNYHNKETDEYYNSLGEDEEPDDEILNSLNTTVFYDVDSIDQIVPYLVSNEVYTYRWDGGKGVEPDYSVQLSFNSEGQIGKELAGYIPTYAFLEGEVPGFVEEDTSIR
ncbi:MAG: DUF6449 domain-containing protein [Lachnospiraceae bacterium]|nr:DUF6449 domain-containing protein [Lachnospiraceae bacterium]